MYEQDFQDDLLFMMLYGAVAMLSLIASCYLLFRRGNAFAPDIASPVRLRRWTAAFFACMTLSHVWYLPILFLTTSDNVKLGYLVGAMLDYLMLVPLAIVVLFSMLQDRRRPLWPVAVMTAPPFVIMAWCVVSRSDALPSMLYGYLLLLGVCLITYMVRATRQYGSWLRDNYADLEHKEVWHSFVVLAVMLLVFGIYSIGIRGPVYQYVFQINDVVLICYLLWRVETLSELNIPVFDAEEGEAGSTEDVEDNDLPLPVRNGSTLAALPAKDIELLLQKYCIDSQLYLRPALTLPELAKAVGTNHFYLSQYFSSQGMSYNAYINDLRINHFISLYREAVDAQRSITAQQLALESGYRSYNTFRDAFKRKTGQSVTAWMKAASERGQSQARLDSAEREQSRQEGKTASEQEQSQARLDSAEREQSRQEGQGCGQGST